MNCETCELTHQFTPTTDLAPGTFRAWVQAVSSSGELSAWSVPIDFVISQTDPVDLPSTDLSHLLTNRLTRNFATHPSAAPHDMTTQPEPDNPEFIDLVFSQATEGCRMRVDEWLLLCSNMSLGAERPQGHRPGKSWFE